MFTRTLESSFNKIKAKSSINTKGIKEMDEDCVPMNKVYVTLVLVYEPIHVQVMSRCSYKKRWVH